MGVIKRRTIDASKLRRTVKKSRISESVNGSWFIYVRFFAVWLFVVSLDFILEFRFEFLWPFWLLLKTTYDSFRYQGMGLTILFLLLTVCSDLLFLFFLPVQWLFFVASTYVWVQFVCNAGERGPCLSTVSLWLLFVYVEASVRLRDMKSLPFHLDLCRPFAAHCIGYPVVNLGYGFKSYVGYKMRNLNQAKVAKENDFYLQLVSYALPSELVQRHATDKGEKQVVSVDDYSSFSQRKNNAPALLSGVGAKSDSEMLSSSEPRRRGLKVADVKSELDDKQGTSCLSLTDLELATNISAKEPTKKSGAAVESEYFKVSNGRVSQPRVGASGGNAAVPATLSATTSDIRRSGSSLKLSNSKKGSDDDEYVSDSAESSASSGLRCSQDSSPKSGSRSSRASVDTCAQSKWKEEVLHRRRTEQQLAQLESESRKLRSDVASLRQVETDLRARIESSHSTERLLRVELAQLREENTDIQQRLGSIAASKNQEKSTITSLEKKLRCEREARLSLESQLKDLRRRAKSEQEAVTPRAAENHDACLTRRQELEAEVGKLQSMLDESRGKYQELEREKAEAMSNGSHAEMREKMMKDVELLTGALAAMQGKNIHLENSLNSETRLKLDLFSALGDARRQLEIAHGQLRAKGKEVELLKARIADVMSVMPPQYHGASSMHSGYSSMTQGDSFASTCDSNPCVENGVIPVTSSSFLSTSSACL